MPSIFEFVMSLIIATYVSPDELYTKKMTFIHTLARFIACLKSVSILPKVYSRGKEMPRAQKARQRFHSYVWHGET